MQQDHRQPGARSGFGVADVEHVRLDLLEGSQRLAPAGARRIRSLGSRLADHAERRPGNAHGGGEEESASLVDRWGETS
jgi:hypothetical protein